MPDADARSVLSFYALATGNVRQLEPLHNAGGWSGSRLWRVTVSEGAFYGAQNIAPLASRPLVGAGIPVPQLGERLLCLRRWPKEHPPKLDLSVNHRLLRRIAASLPIVAYPFKTAAGQSYVEHNGYLWEMTDWRPGKADYHDNPNQSRLRAAMHSLARFHELSALQSSAASIPGTFFDRWRLCREMEGGGLAAIERALASPLGNEIDLRAGRLLHLAGKALQPLSYGRKPVALEVMADLAQFHVIRDLHHDHVLFSGDEVTGLIDFGAMRIDTPLTDIARLVGSLVGDDNQARDFALSAYSEIRPLSDSDRRLVDYLDESGLVFGALHWLTWLYVERRDMGPIEPIVRRLDEIRRRLEFRFAG
jgi:Ser/Thr protein kinase RdoA (MazF antagonist)